MYANTNKFLKISKTDNLYTVITPYRSSSRVFMTNNTPSGAKKHRESTEPESRQTPKMFFLFFIFFFRRASSNLLYAFTMVFAQNSSIFHWAVHQPIAFLHVRSHTRRFEPLTEELWLPLRRHFFFLCTHAHKSLSNKMQLIRKIAELEILSVCREYLKPDLVSDSWANTA